VWKSFHVLLIKKFPKGTKLSQKNYQEEKETLKFLPYPKMCSFQDVDILCLLVVYIFNRNAGT